MRELDEVKADALALIAKIELGHIKKKLEDFPFLRDPDTERGF